MALEAVIWDMDGVLVDSAAFHLQAWQELAAARGLQFSESDFQRTFGMRNPEIVQAVFGTSISRVDAEVMADRKEALYRAAVKNRIAALPGAVRLLQSLRQAGVKMALASSAPFENVELVLSELDIRDYFAAIVSEKDVKIGKPNPQVFLLAAKMLRAAPVNCLVIEDAVPGVRAAKAAGMKCIAVVKEDRTNEYMESDLVVDTLEKVDLGLLIADFGLRIED